MVKAEEKTMKGSVHKKLFFIALYTVIRDIEGDNNTDEKNKYLHQ